MAYIPMKNDILIPILGRTGAGKSTFINAAAGRGVAAVGHDLAPCTAEVQHFIIPYPCPADPTRRIVLVDTPGFDHTSLDDSDVLGRIVNWLEPRHRNGTELAGIIHLHEISQPRMTNAKGNIDLKLDFRQLYPASAVNNVILATTKWSEVGPELAEPRERELSREYCLGSRNMVRFDVTRNSAWNIIELILNKNPTDGPPFYEELIKFWNPFLEHPRKKKPKKRGGLAGWFGSLFGKR